MRNIIYAGDTFLTGDDIAKAVLDYGRALAQSSNSETVEIPTLRPDGTRVAVSLLLGPASQIVAEHVPEADGEILDAELVAHMRRRIEALEHPSGEMVDPPVGSGLDDY